MITQHTTDQSGNKCTAIDN